MSSGGIVTVGANSWWAPPFHEAMSNSLQRVAKPRPCANQETGLTSVFRPLRVLRSLPNWLLRGHCRWCRIIISPSAFWRPRSWPPSFITTLKEEDITRWEFMMISFANFFNWGQKILTTFFGGAILMWNVRAKIFCGWSKKCQEHLSVFLQVSSKSAHCTPVAMQKLHKSSDMSLDYSSLGSEAKSRYENHENPEEYTKLLRRRMISEVLQKPPNNDIWQLQQQQPNSESAGNRSRNQRETKRRNQRRSHSAQGRRSETQSEVNAVKPSKPLTPTKPGLGRRSATQLEISRRKTKEESPALMQKTKWHSQENLDTVRKVFF